MLFSSGSVAFRRPASQAFEITTIFLAGGILFLIRSPAMSVFDVLTRYGSMELHTAYDAAVGMRAMVAVHDVRLGPAVGGCRIATYESEELAVLDVTRLARAMTAKAALA